MSQTIEVKVPDIGDYKDVPVIEVLVKPGDTVAAETSLVTLESDKATMDIPSPAAGVVKDLKIKVGDKVGQGSLILTLETAGTAAPAKPAPAAAAPAAPAKAPAPAAAPVTAPAPAAPAATGGGGTIEVTVPDIGDYKDVPVIEVFVKAGDTVKAEDSLMTLESDKATMDIPSPAAGTVKDVKIKVGDKVSKGTLVLTLASGAAPAAAPAAAAPSAAPAAAAAPAPAASTPAAVKSAAPTASLEPMDETSFGLAHASPSVRRFARELGVNLGKVKGSGPKGRIVKEDVQAFVKGELTRPKASPATGGLPFNLPPMPQVDFAKFGPVESQPLTRIKKLSGAALHRNWVSIPHITQFDEADITELEAFRKGQADDLKKQGVRFTLLAFLLKAVVVALKQYPHFNASLAPDGENLILKKYFHIGVAVDTPLGLVVPVLRDVDKKGLVDLAKELGDISARMRDGKINPADLQGGCFSISSLGGIGGTAFTPIINAPEVAILGVSKGQLKPQWDGKQFAPRLMLPLSLSYDHRVIDGAQGAHFIAYLSSVLSDIRRLVL
jgi:pyruvate dehydrogenase E2 component (dihydrolipoamide acetyltransferase)